MKSTIIIFNHKNIFKSNYEILLKKSLKNVRENPNRTDKNNNKKLIDKKILIYQL